VTIISTADTAFKARRALVPAALACTGVVCGDIKYAILIMRASNHGEGGILALLALICPQHAKRGAGVPPW
jgi:K+ transporter